jgi:5-methylcytosine-specific restriction endonuclease McrA
MTDFHRSARWRRKRAAILRRDKYLCVECKKYGRISEAVIVHHIKPVEEYPELGYISSNLESLCAACHNAKHPEKGVAGIRGRQVWGK